MKNFTIKANFLCFLQLLYMNNNKYNYKNTLFFINNLKYKIEETVIKTLFHYSHFLFLVLYILKKICVFLCLKKI